MTPLIGLAFGAPIASALVATLIAFDKLTPAVEAFSATPRRVNQVRRRIFYRSSKDRQQSGFKVSAVAPARMEAGGGFSYWLTASALYVLAGLVWLFRIEAA